jgi:hypothetical protein
MTNIPLSPEAIEELIKRNDAQEMLRAATHLRKWLGDVRELVDELEQVIVELEGSTSKQGDNHGTEEGKRKEIGQKVLSQKTSSG